MQLFCVKILKVQKRQSIHECLFTLLGSLCGKATRKMLVKSTPAVNFINVKHAHFSYKCYFSSFFLLHVHSKSCWNVRSYEKFVRLRWWNWLPDGLRDKENGFGMHHFFFSSKYCVLFDMKEKAGLCHSNLFCPHRFKFQKCCHRSIY